VGGSVRFFLNDHLGSTTTTLRSSSGQKEGDLLYDPWGAVRWSWQSTATRYLLTAQRWDDTLSLYGYQARYCCPDIGRLISADTIVPDPAAPRRQVNDGEGP
jgi:RHS repeat-associated protein